MQLLKEIQQQFWKGLRTPEDSLTYDEFIFSDNRLSATSKLNIYRQTCRTAHINALAQCYSYCEKILGEHYFRQLARQYFYQHPSRNQNLNDYGDQFAAFLQNCVISHTELEDFPYLPDLARFEFALERAYFAKDDGPFDFSSFVKLNTNEYENICFELSAPITLLKSDYPIYEIWLANHEKSKSQEVKVISEPQYLCIYREDYKPKVTKLEPAYWQILKEIQLHYSLNQLEENLENNEIDIFIQTMIPELIQKKWICGYFLKHNP